MRISFVLDSTERWGGVMYLLNLARELSESGHNLSIVSRTPEPDWFPLGKIRYFHLPDLLPEMFPEAEIGVASFWTTIEKVHRCTQFNRKYHICQGYEAEIPIFMEHASEIEDAYRLPLERLVVSGHLQDILLERFNSPSFLLGQFINHDTFFPREKPLASEPPFRITVVGPYETEFKGVPFILRVLRTLRDSYQFVVQRVSLTPLTDEERLLSQSDLYFYRMSQRELGNLYRETHILIHAPASCEGFGLPPFEAAACGALPLVSDIPSYRPFKELDKFPERDEESLAKLLTGYMENPDKITSLQKVLMDLTASMDVGSVAKRFIEYTRET